MSRIEPECGVPTQTDSIGSSEFNISDRPSSVKATTVPVVPPLAESCTTLQGRKIEPQDEIDSKVDHLIDMISETLENEALTLEQLVELVFCRARLQLYKLSKMHKEGAFKLVDRKYAELDRLEKAFNDPITKGISIATALVTIVASVAGVTLGAAGGYQMLMLSPDNPAYAPVIQLGMNVVTVVTQGTSGLSNIQKPLNDRQQGKQTRLSELLKATDQVLQQAHGSDRESRESMKKCGDQLDQVFQSLHQATERVAGA